MAIICNTGLRAYDSVLILARNGITDVVNAAGGIASLADAEEFIRLGADRLGTSRIVKIAMAQEQQAAEAAAAPQQPEAAAQPQAPEQQDTTY